MSRIYWDTMLFVYWFEDNPQYAQRISEIYEALETRGDTLWTSVFTVGEVLTGPYKRCEQEEAARIREFFSSSRIHLIPFTEETADRYARIRGESRVSPADAIHLASAAQAGVDLMLTNEAALRRLIIPGIHFIAGLDVNLF